jgi:Arc/MetJ family transcription regulator
MRSTIDIDEKLLKEAMRLTQARTKKELINKALKELIKRKRIEEFRRKLGQFDLDIDLQQLEEMRSGE